MFDLKKLEDLAKKNFTLIIEDENFNNIEFFEKIFKLYKINLITIDSNLDIRTSRIEKSILIYQSENCSEEKTIFKFYPLVIQTFEQILAFNLEEKFKEFLLKNDCSFLEKSYPYILNKVNIPKEFSQRFRRSDEALSNYLNEIETFKLTILLWKFICVESIDQDETKMENMVIILENIDCFLEDSEVNNLLETINIYLTKFQIKVVILTHSSKLDLIVKYIDEYQILDSKLNTVGIEIFKKLTKSCKHGFINKFSANSLPKLSLCIRHRMDFKHLEQFEDWKNIPRFAILIGNNGIGKTTFLRYLETEYRNSLYISDLSNLYKSFELSHQLDKFLDQISESCQYFRDYKSSVRNTEKCKNHLFEKIIKFMETKKIAEENYDRILLYLKYIPNFIKFVPKWYISLLLLISDGNALNKYLVSKGFKYKIIQKSCPHFEENFSYFLKHYYFEIFFLECDDITIDYENLSPSEKWQLVLYLWEYDYHNESEFKELLEYSSEMTEKRERFVLLMDEPDTHLHPSKLKDIIDFIDKTLVQKMNIQVIMTTHNACTYTLCAAEKKDVFMLFKNASENRIKIIPANQCPVDPIEYLWSVNWTNNQHLVIVETEIEKLYYENLNLQLNLLAIAHEEPRFKLFPKSLRFEAFVTSSKNRNYIKDFITNNKDTNSQKQNALKIIKSFWQSYIEEIDESLVNVLQKAKKLKRKQLLKSFHSYLNDLRDITENPLTEQIIKDFQESYSRCYKGYDEENSRIFNMIYFIQAANQYSDFECFRRNFTFGIVNRKDCLSDIIRKNDFLLFTDRKSFENILFDPISLFYLLQKEEPQHELVKNLNVKFSKLKSNYSDSNSDILKNLNIDFDNWNKFVDHKDAISTKENDLRSFFESFYQIVHDSFYANLSAKQEIEKDESKDESSDEKDDEYEDCEDDDNEREFIELIQPRIKIISNSFFLDADESEILGFLRKIFSNKFEKLFLNSDDIPESITTEIEKCAFNMLKLLTKKHDFKFPVSANFIKKFQFLYFYSMFKFEKDYPLHDMFAQESEENLIKKLVKKKDLLFLEDFQLNGETKIEKQDSLTEAYLTFNQQSTYASISHLFSPNRSFITPLHVLVSERKFDLFIKLHEFLKDDLRQILTKKADLYRFIDVEVRFLSMERNLKELDIDYFKKLGAFIKTPDEGKEELKKRQEAMKAFGKVLKKVADYIQNNFDVYGE